MTNNHDSYWENIAGKLHGELSHDEEAEFSQLMADSSNRHEFEKTQRIHDDLVKTGSISANGKMKSWARVEDGIRHFHLRWIKVVMKYAAIIIVALSIGYLLRSLTLTGFETLSGFGANRYSEITVPFGQMSQLTLSDGTKIWLNSGTTIRYPERFAEKRREISVEGEAYFEVTKLPNKPFTINTAEMKVEVLGTSFNLSAYREDATSSVTLV